MSALEGLGLGLGGDTLEADQVEREAGARQLALGRRASLVMSGGLGPVLKRWANAAVKPTSTRLSGVATALLSGNTGDAVRLASSPLLGSPRFSASPALSPILKWSLKGDNADDFVLSAFGTVLREVSHGGGGAGPVRGVPVTRLVLHAGDACREAALGQFLTQVQGAKAMLGVRRKGAPEWHGTRRLHGTANLLAGQVRAGLQALSESDDYSIPARGKEVVKVLTPKGDLRRIDLRRPTEDDWKLLDVARQVDGEKDNNRATWATLGMLIIMCAQAEAGWFDLVKQSKTVLKSGTRLKRPMGAAHALVLSEGARDAITKDLDKWLRMGFTREPMVTPPVDGDYITVKHKPVAGGRGPMGLRTDATGTAPWRAATETLGKTPWAVNTGVLDALERNEFLRAHLEAEVPDEIQRETLLNAHKVLASTEKFYLPLYMDFRGRVYTQTPNVTYQGSKLQKALLRFPKGSPVSESSSHIRAVAMHTSALMGLDKLPVHERVAWYQEEFTRLAREVAVFGWDSAHVTGLLEKADDPLGLAGALWLERLGQGYDYDCLPCQLDGTCNGLQHLSALFRDEEAAKYVNLTDNGGAVAGDAYGEVARRVAARLVHMDAPWVNRVAHLCKIDRKLLKRPVMVLPYGGTKQTIEDQITQGILEQAPEAQWWQHPAQFKQLGAPNGRQWVPDEEAIADGFGAYPDRPLEKHPLFHQDMKRLSMIVWECICETFPKAMRAMQAFRDIAKVVGERSLEWQLGFEVEATQRNLMQGQPPLWIVQAKPKSSAVPLNMKGLHLPASIRALKMYPGRDEVDAHSHVSGIVANFIHSQDGDHLARTLWYARAQGVHSMGATHDALKARPSDIATMAAAVRDAFAEKYLRHDPLGLPVRLRDKEGGIEAFPSWYALAEACGVSFPDKGSWEPAEVRESRWFFS